jgi:hypothetical protein
MTPPHPQRVLPSDKRNENLITFGTQQHDPVWCVCLCAEHVGVERVLEKYSEWALHYLLIAGAGNWNLAQAAKNKASQPHTVAALPACHFSE